MCGIVGVFHFDPERPVDVDLLVRQTDAIAHRGPDDGGAWAGRGVGLGHRRLSIIDVAGGHQPMWDLEDRVAVVFNGEIYNYRELAEQLEAKGHRFRTRSDTEVILCAFREWGAACVDRFNGMFAFALFDKKTRTVFLARDRMGKKPLYYYRDGDRVIFASEIKAILADPTVPRLLDPHAALDFFAYNYVPGPQTILQNIHKLPAGHSMFLSSDDVRIARYWDVDFSQAAAEGRVEDSATRVLEQLSDAVRLRLRSDVPLGAFLSGGVDSSLVVAQMAKQLEGPVKTNTIGFSEAGYDERGYAKETAELYATEHTERLVRADAAAIVEDLAWFYDEPFGDSSAVPTYYLCEATRGQVTVALSGDGGDENFAGYRRYVFAMYEAAVRNRLPGVVRDNVVAPLARAYPKADFLPRFLRAKATLTNLSVDHERAYFYSLTQKTYPRYLSNDFLGGLNGYDPYHHFERHLARANTTDPLARLQYVDLKMYLCDDILVKVDRASMAHALEVRVPLLDHRMVQLAAGLPPKHKLEGDRTKIALKAAAEKLLPASILDRKKMGFTIPLPEWFRGDLLDSTQALFFDRSGGQSGLLDTPGLRRMWYEHQIGLRNHATVFWSIAMFEHWVRRYLGAQDVLAGQVLPRTVAPTRVHR